MEWLQASLSYYEEFKHLCLNPCSDGMASSKIYGEGSWNLVGCLNPCSDGMASSSILDGDDSAPLKVLILVLMEWLQALILLMITNMF